MGTLMLPCALLLQQIHDAGGDYVLALNGNQGTLCEDATLFLNSYILAQDKKTLAAIRQYARTIEKDHGRIESRECYITTDIGWLLQKEA